jgi:hypothetical protein
MSIRDIRPPEAFEWLTRQPPALCGRGAIAVSKVNPVAGSTATAFR